MLYTRKRCGLCQQAERLVRTEVGNNGFAMCDIDDDDVLRDRYDVRVPVVVVDGVEIAAFELAPGVVRRAVAAARRRRRRSSRAQ